MEHSMQVLQRELDRCKSEIFLRRGEAHLAHLLCSVNVVWAEDAVTAYTNALIISINPVFFMQLPVKTRETVLAHELWHIAMLHLVRGAGKDWYLWNAACDYWINGMLHNKGYSFEGTAPWLDHRYDGMAVEEIYDDLVDRQAKGTMDDLGMIWGYKDLEGKFDEDDLRHPTEGATYPNDGTIPPVDPTVSHKIVNAVVQSTQYAAQNPGGYSGSAPVADLIKQFLQPKVRWEKEVLPFWTALDNYDYDWTIPSSRIRHTYMPSLRKGSQGGLTHVAWFGDSSGSMTKSQLVRWNSEARYLKKRFNPELFTMINFDDQIQMAIEMKRTDRFEEIEVVGRGGTDLTCVRNWIIHNKPKAAIIFSDMACAEMEPLPPSAMIPILWVVLNNPTAKVPHGRVVHISE